MAKVHVGDAVYLYDVQGEAKVGLVTTVWDGSMNGEGGKGENPTINVVVIDSDPNKRDPCGRQIDRSLTSLQHAAGLDHQPGRKWTEVAARHVGSIQ